MVRIAAVLAGPNDGTSLYRGLGPLRAMESMGNDLEVFLTRDYRGQASFGWEEAHKAHIFFGQRLTTPDHAAAFDYARLCGLPTWVDYDDDLFAVPEWNGAHKTYSKKQNQDAIAHVITKADIVTVSTHVLRESLTRRFKLGSNVVVIPNAFDDFAHVRPWKEGTAKMFCWRGSDTHLMDIHEYQDAFFRLAEEFPDWGFVFMGFAPYPMLRELKRKTDKVQVVPFMDPIFALNTVMHRFSSAVHLVPLEDDALNRSKSNIAALEATYSGSRVVVPNWEHWKQIPGTVAYEVGNVDSFFNAAKRAALQKAGDPEEGWKWIQKNLLLSEVNTRRVQVIRTLMAKAQAGIEGADLYSEQAGKNLY